MKIKFVFIKRKVNNSSLLEKNNIKVYNYKKNNS